MYVGGAYITYSELFDRRPSLAEVEEIFAPLNLVHTTVLLSRMSIHLRHGFQRPSTQGIAWVQRFLFHNFTDLETFNRLQSRFAASRFEDRPIFHPLQLLNALRIALRVCAGSEDRRPDLDPDLRHRVGTALLMINDLLLTEEEQLAASAGTDHERRASLMAQSVAPFEVMNPGQSWHLLFRSHVTYEVLLQDRILVAEISRRCRGFDFHTQFSRSSGLPLRTWLNLVFAAYAHYFGRSTDDLVANPGLFIIDRRNFIRGSSVGQREFDLFLRTISRPIPQLRNELRALERVDPRFDLIPFQSRPLSVLSKSTFACLDAEFLITRLYTGPHWLIHDVIPEVRDDLFTAWGIVFEKYVSWLFEGMDRKPGLFLAFPKFANGEEAFDGLFLAEDILLPIEYKGGFLGRGPKYSGSKNEFTDELDRKIGGGCRQLAAKIDSLFNESTTRRRRLAHSLPLARVRKVIPLLVVQDQSLRGPFVNWWLNNYFQGLIGGFKLREGLEILPLNVASIEDLETMVESAEMGGFDFVYSLRYRAWRDPEMLSQFHNFMLGVRGYGEHGSRRFNDYLDRVKERMFSYIFPKG